MSLARHVDIAEEITSLFQPDILLPTQYLESTKRKFEAMPEKALMLAVLEDAFYSFQKYLLVPDKRGKLLFRETERWIFDDDDSGVFSYRNVCEVLGINAEYLRRGLLRCREKRLASHGHKIRQKYRIQGA